MKDVEIQKNFKTLIFSSAILGILFSWILISIGGTDFDVMIGMFQLTNFQLPIVLSLSVVIGAIGMFIVRRMNANSIISQKEITFGAMPFNKRTVFGAILFGVGWGITASCPGTALAMIGEGKVSGILVAIGAFIGTIIYGIINKK